VRGIVALELAVERNPWHPDYSGLDIIEGGASKDFDAGMERKNLRKSKARWVLIGNSMLNTRIDNDELTAISGVKARKVSRGGSQSGLWLLFLKSVILQSGNNPALLTIFFRETDLTWPELRVDGLNKSIVDQLEAEKHPEWQQVLMRPKSAGSGVIAKLETTLEDLFPYQHLRTNARRNIQNRSFRATRVGTEVNGSIRRIELNERFDLNNLRHDLGGDRATSAGGTAQSEESTGQVVDPGFYEDGPTVFEPSPDASFLPHLISLCKEHHIKLHFHRIKRRPFEDGTRPDSDALAAYISALSQYLQKEGCLFTDESEDLSLTLDMYADGDHISADPVIQKKYLQNFWARVRPIVESHCTALPTPKN
jgi:hypothetical protein